MSPVSGFGLGLLGAGEAPAPPWTDAAAWGTVIGEYDFSDLSKIAADGSNRVTSVASKTGTAPAITNGGNLSWSPKTGVRLSPTGLNALDFPVPSGAERLYCILTGHVMPITLVHVMVDDQPALMDLQASGDAPGLYKTNYSSKDQWVVMNNQYGYTQVTPDSAWHVFVLVFNGVNSEFWVDGNKIKTVNDGGGNLTRLVVGNYGNGGYSVDGAYGHMIWFQGVPADIGGMSKSLKKRWIG